MRAMDQSGGSRSRSGVTAPRVFRANIDVREQPRDSRVGTFTIDRHVATVGIGFDRIEPGQFRSVANHGVRGRRWRRSERRRFVDLDAHSRNAVVRLHADTKLLTTSATNRARHSSSAFFAHNALLNDDGKPRRNDLACHFELPAVSVRYASTPHDPHTNRRLAPPMAKSSQFHETVSAQATRPRALEQVALGNQFRIIRTEHRACHSRNRSHDWRAWDVGEDVEPLVDPSTAIRSVRMACFSLVPVETDWKKYTRTNSSRVETSPIGFDAVRVGTLPFKARSSSRDRINVVHDLRRDSVADCSSMVTCPGVSSSSNRSNSLPMLNFKQK